MTGIELIAIERGRRISDGETSEQDDKQVGGELALAAACYATPVQLYVKREQATSLSFDDPWPPSLDAGLDKRFSYGERRNDEKNRAPDPASYSHEERLDLLVKAGALIAAEIDRLQRIREPKLAVFSQHWLFVCDFSSAKEC